MADELQCISPVDGSVYLRRRCAGDEDIAGALQAAGSALVQWRRRPLTERQEICSRAVTAFAAREQSIAEELSWQMGRPIRCGPGEVRGFVERARYMIEIAARKLAPVTVPEQTGFTRFIQRQPVGVVLTIAPWNYPYLTAVNSVIPALVAGNCVLLKPSSQTPLTGERLAEVLAEAGMPHGVFQNLLLSHEATASLIRSAPIDYVSFTGSESGGRQVETAAAGRFIDTGLELGGKDAAYVRADADLAHAVENLVDGACFNSGQSCCGIERIYVHNDIYEPFVSAFAELVGGYRLGNPLDPETTLGPMVSTAAADRVRAHIADALAQGAVAAVDSAGFDSAREGTPYLAPQVLLRVNHNMQVMREETFGPVVGIMPVAGDDEAIALINDSRYGLTGSVWTRDAQAAVAIGEQVAVGTWFMNRCDYLDPALAWTGVKCSGKGCTLSEIGYERLTRPKSFNLRTQP